MSRGISTGRRQFLRVCGGAAMALKSESGTLPSTEADALGGSGSTVPCALRLRFGVAQFDRYDPLADISQLAKWGFDYCEPAVTKVMELDDAQFREAAKKAATSGIHVECMNSFVPADLKVVGFEIDHARLRNYLRNSLSRADALGAKAVVFGSGDARMVPDGLSKQRAWVQLQDFLGMAGDEIAQNRYGMLIGIEALRKAESNIVNTSAEAYELAIRTNHPKIRMIVDFFHLVSEGEDPAIMRQAADYIIHIHFSDPFRGRMLPSLQSQNPAFLQFFSDLRAIGYQGRLSLEAYTNNFETDAPAGLAAVKKLYDDTCAI
jgi:D-psicose/D-tagatose/L-ribulose 3-epimerase